MPTKRTSAPRVIWKIETGVYSKPTFINCHVHVGWRGAWGVGMSVGRGHERGRGMWIAGGERSAGKEKESVRIRPFVRWFVDFSFGFGGMEDLFGAV